MVGLVALGTVVAAPGAWAVPAFSAAGDAELIPGLKDAQAQNISLSYGLPKVEVDLPRDLFAEVSAVRAIDATDAGLPCEAFPDRAVYVCGNGSVRQPVTGVLFLYVVPQVRPGTGNLYPMTYDVGVLDPGSRAAATVHVTLRPEVDLALHGPYAATDGGHGAGITVYVENLGPSDAQGATVTLSFSGAYTTFGLPVAGCTASGAVATCPLPELRAGQQVPVSVALGPGTGVISVLGRVSGPDEDIDHGNNAGVGGPWNLFPGNGPAASGPPPPAVPPHGVPLPLPVPAPDATPGAVAPVPVRARSGTTAPARVAAATATPAWARDLAIVFLCVSSVYLAVAGAVWLRRRWRAL